MNNWTPDQPLRADATDRQIGERIDRVYNHSVARGDWTSGAVGIAECFVAREFAAACVGASAVAPDTRDARIAELEKLIQKAARKCALDLKYVNSPAEILRNVDRILRGEVVKIIARERDAARATPTGETK